MNGINYTLTEGYGFIIIPGELAYYQADECDPWNYSWVAFHGTYAESCIDKIGFSSQLPVFKINEEYKSSFESILSDLITLDHSNKLYLNLKKTGYLCELLSIIALCGPLYEFNGDKKETKTAKKNYTSNIDNHINQAVDYIYKNYTRQITIKDIAEYVHIDKHYLSEIFRKKVGKSPHNVLESLRIRIACELLKSSTLSVGDVSRSVGYSDQLQFSRIFKKIIKMNPTEFRSNFKLL